MSVRLPWIVAALAVGARALAAEPPPGGLEQRMAELAPRPGGLTADGVARRAAATSPDVRAHQEDARAAAALVDQTLALAFPRVGVTASYRRLSPITLPSLTSGGNLVATSQLTQGPLDPSSQLFAVGVTFPVLLDNYSLQASLSVPISDYVLRVSQGLSAARHSRASSELATRAAQLKAAADARLLFYNWVRARGAQLISAEALATARGHLDDLNKMFAVGMVSRADVMRVDSQVAQTELLVERAANLTRVLEQQLRTALHDPSSAPYALGEDLLGPLAPLQLPQADEALVDEALGQRPELRALAEGLSSLRDQAKLARAGYYPRLDAFGNVIYANPNPRIFPQVDQFTATWDVGVALSWSPNDVAGTVPGSHAADARAAQLEAQRQQVVDGVRVEIAAARSALREADLAVLTTARGLAAAEESYRVRRELFRQGKATSVELTDAENDLARARLESINARIDQRVARVRVVHATGRDAIAER
jgi:outer membrane protein TolC